MPPSSGSGATGVPAPATLAPVAVSTSRAATLPKKPFASSALVVRDPAPLAIPAAGAHKPHTLTPARAPTSPLKHLDGVSNSLTTLTGGSGASSAVGLLATLTSILLAITSLGRRFRPTPELVWSPAYVALSDRPG